MGSEQGLLGELAVIGALAVVAAVGLRRIRVPATIGFLLVGSVAGPNALGLVGNTDDITEIAEVGVILLLFAIGLEFSLSRLRFIWRAVAVGGSIQVGATTAIAIIVLTGAGVSAERATIFGFRGRAVEHGRRPARAPGSR